MKITDTTDLTRRSFLKGAAVSTVVVSSAAIAGNTAAQNAPEPATKSKQGYTLTRHVKEYYRLARF